MEHRLLLNALPSAFFSVCLHIVSGTPEAEREARTTAEDFVASCEWTPSRNELFAGALKYTRDELFKRFMMTRIVKSCGGSTDTTHDHEYTDRAQVARFCTEMVGVAQAERVTA